jgi:hypothetical protein
MLKVKVVINELTCIIIEHYHFDIFKATTDFQLQELDSRISKRVMEFLTVLDPNDAYKSFSIDDICSLAENFYPLDFFEQMKLI